MAAVLKFCRWGERRAIPCCLYIKEALQLPCWGAACPGNGCPMGSGDSLWKQILKVMQYVGKYLGIVLLLFWGREGVGFHGSFCFASEQSPVAEGSTAPRGCIARSLVTALPLACTSSWPFLSVAARGREFFPPIYWTVAARSHSHRSAHGSHPRHRCCCCWDLPQQLPERAPAEESCHPALCSLLWFAFLLWFIFFLLLFLF